MLTANLHKVSARYVGCCCMKRIIKPDKIDVLFQTDVKLVTISHLAFDKVFFLQPYSLFGFMEAFHAGPRILCHKQMDNLKSLEKKLTYNSLISFFFPFSKMVLYCCRMIPG